MIAPITSMTAIFTFLFAVLVVDHKIINVKASFHLQQLQEHNAKPPTATKRPSRFDDSDSIDFLDSFNGFKPPCPNIKNRRSVFNTFLPKLLFGSTMVHQFVSTPKSAHAVYGDSSNIQLPSYIDFLIEKNQQMDPSKVLYQGADRSRQLERIAFAVSKLKTIPDILQSKKWSQVQGILTGPLGTLIATMNEVVSSIANDEIKKKKDAQQVLVKVKGDLYSIGQGATAKNEQACIVATQATLIDLNEFVQIVF